MTWQGVGQIGGPKQVYGLCSRLGEPFLAPMQVAAEREWQKAQAAAAAERAAFEAQEARMAAELEQRTQQERKLLQEAAQRAREAAEQRRRCLPVLCARPESVTRHPAFNAKPCDQRKEAGAKEAHLI